MSLPGTEPKYRPATRNVCSLGSSSRKHVASTMRADDPELNWTPAAAGAPQGGAIRSHLCGGSGSPREGPVNLEPPSGSRISVTTDGGHPLIVIPHGDSGLMRHFVGLFLLAWLGGWFAGFSSAVSKLLSGEAPAFLIFWLIAWNPRRRRRNVLGLSDVSPLRAGAEAAAKQRDIRLRHSAASDLFLLRISE